MTNKELYQSITEGAVVTAEMAQKAQELLAKQAEEATKAAQKRAEKKSAEDAPIFEAVKTLLTSATEPMTATAIGQAVEISTSKATFVAKNLDGIKVGEVRVGSRIVKTYAL